MQELDLLLGEARGLGHVLSVPRALQSLGLHREHGEQTHGENGEGDDEFQKAQAPLSPVAVSFRHQFVHALLAASHE